MSIWSRLMGWKNTGDTNKVAGKEDVPPPDEAPRYTIVDVEVGVKDRKIHDILTTSADTTSSTTTPDTCLPTPPTTVRW